MNITDQISLRNLLTTDKIHALTALANNGATFMAQSKIEAQALAGCIAALLAQADRLGYRVSLTTGRTGSRERLVQFVNVNADEPSVFGIVEIELLTG